VWRGNREDIRAVNMKSISPPNSGFILLVDCDGDPKEVYSHNCVIDEVMRRCQVLDGEDPSDAPHSAWMWGTGRFSRVTDRIGE